MELFNKTPKERMVSYNNGPTASTPRENAAPEAYLKSYMDFMADLPNGYGDRPDSEIEPEEDREEVPVEKASKDYVTARKPGTSHEFMRQYGKLISDKADSLGLAKDMLLAQIALETGWGGKTPGHNIGGIKADSNWKGRTQVLSTMEYSPSRGNYRTDQTFRKYDTPEEGVEDYFNFLQKNKRYKPLFGELDPYKAVDIMAKTGYATDKKYKPKLYELVKQIQAMQV